ncbi:alpha/beta hydrolase [Ammoniphilus sp. 3BR4]|uniref:alpha/beta hydrolase n=1 Tax=Ammoniphilus sp. 3BR4 TaxID=3158265 RepID=UPI00346671A6
MPLHPLAKRYLDAAPKSITEAPVSKLRNLEKIGLPPESDRPAVGSIEDRMISGPGGEIPIRIYTPEGDGPFPLLVFFHGGGFVRGSIETHDVSCRNLVRASGWKVISVGYRLAPEHPFPAGLEDCYAGLQWTVQHVDELQGDAEQIAVGGDSAGGNLAAAVAIMARDRGGPSIAKQVLMYPVTDYHRHGIQSPYPSYQEKGTGYGLTSKGMGLYWQYYLKQQEEGDNPYASPMKSANLMGLPPAVVVTAEYDPLCDEGERYAERLREAGVAVVSRRFNGMIHGFLNWLEDMEEKTDAYKLIGSFLQDR